MDCSYNLAERRIIRLFTHLPHSFLQMNTIFISILIEALPFVLIGVFIAGFIQMFISEQFIARIIPKNKFLAVIVGSVIGVFFPSCECGIVPIVRNLMLKGVPLHAGIAFMLTAPIINPVVVFSTYVAFGSTWEMPILRIVGSLVVAIIVGNAIAYFYKGTGLKDRFLRVEEAVHEEPHPHEHHHHHKLSFSQKVWHTLQHAVDEFFSVGKYLVLGALLAAAMQTYIKTSTLSAIGHGPVLSILLMMVLAFLLSLCSEADAFIGASFRSVFSTQSIVAFLVFGPMLDIKNLLMMGSTFKAKFILYIVAGATAVVFLYALLLIFIV